MVRRISETEIKNQIEIYKDLIETMKNPLHKSPLGYNHVINPEITQDEIQGRIRELENTLRLRKAERN